jgi:hypothetical protein
MTHLDFARRSLVAAVVDGPLMMLFLSVCGMAIGLAIDCGSITPDVLASLCLARSTSLTGGLQAHFALLPATHALMLAGALVSGAVTDAATDGPGQPARSIATMVARHLPNAICAAAMVAGMAAGGFLGPPLVERLGVASGFTRLVVAMVLGMAAGMVLAMPLYRIRDRKVGRHGETNSAARSATQLSGFTPVGDR